MNLDEENGRWKELVFAVNIYWVEKGRKKGKLSGYLVCGAIWSFGFSWLILYFGDFYQVYFGGLSSVFMFNFLNIENQELG